MSGEHILFRPPGEADSLIIRVAEGCPWNRCTFCGMYKGVKYKFLGLGKISGAKVTQAGQVNKDFFRLSK